MVDITYKQMIASVQPAIPFLATLPPIRVGASAVTNAMLSYLQVQAMGDPYNVKVHGAIGDGTSHPLSERYGTGSAGLAAARVVYPLCVSLADEIDLCAAEMAIFSARISGGGYVTAPRGRFIVNRTLWLPECGQGFSPNSDMPQASVSIKGAGDNATAFQALVDFPGHIIDCVNRKTTNWGSIGVLEDMAIIGPGFGRNVGYGQKPCLNDGLGWGSRRVLNRVRIQDCNRGITMVGDQGLFSFVTIESCFDGVYYDEPNTVLFGDQHMVKCIITKSKRAAIAVHPNAQVPKGAWETCIFAASPFGIYKEIAPGSDVDKRWITRSTDFNGTQFENMGLAAMSGGTAMPENAAVMAMVPAQGNDRPRIQNTTLKGCQLGQWLDEVMIPGWTRFAMIDIADVAQGLRILDMREPNLFAPGTVSTIRINGGGDITISGDVDTMRYVADQAGKPMIVNQGNRCDTIFLKNGQSWEGHMRQLNGGFGDNNYQPGDCMVHRGGNVGWSAGAASEMYAGVLMQKPRTDYEYLILARKLQRGPVNTSQTTGSLDNVPLYSGANGRFVPAAVTPHSTFPIGWAYPGSAGALGKQDAVIQ